MGKVAMGLSMSLDGFIAGPTTALALRWVTAVRGSSPGTPAATPNTGCRVPRWYSRSRPRAPRSFETRTARSTFVTDGVQSAVEQAKQVAGEKDVAVGAASIVQQCIRAGLLEEIHIDLVPVLLGEGVRLFDHLGVGPIDLESTEVVEGAGVTHLTFRVVK